MRAALVLHISRYDQPNPKFHTLYETFRKLYCVDANCENKADSNLALLYPTKVSNVLLFLLHVLSAVAMRETKEALESVGSSLEILQEGTIKLKTSLSDERASLSNTLSDPACTNGAVSQTCNTIRSTVPQLGASADFTKVLRTTYYYYYICLMNGSELSFCSPTLIYLFFVHQLPDVRHAVVNVNNVLGTDLSNIVQKVCPGHPNTVFAVIFLFQRVFSSKQSPMEHS